jgi:hypothetical protein
MQCYGEWELHWRKLLIIPDFLAAAESAARNAGLA